MDVINQSSIPLAFQEQLIILGVVNKSQRYNGRDYKVSINLVKENITISDAPMYAPLAVDNKIPWDGKENTIPVRSYNVGKSDHSKHKIQPWDIWLEYKLNPWDADIIKRVLRTKEDTPRVEEYEKIIHDCQERIRQLKEGETKWK